MGWGYIVVRIGVDCFHKNQSVVGFSDNIALGHDKSQFNFGGSDSVFKTGHFWTYIAN